MAVNASWPRWIMASIAKHLHDAAYVAELPLVVEFLDRRDETWMGATHKAEVTISGPATREVSTGLYRVWVNVFVVLTSNLSDNDYDHVTHAGAIANALDRCIVIKDYGNEAGDTGLLDIGTITPRNEGADTVKVTHLKPAAKDTQLHSTIEVRFFGLFTE